MFQVRDWLFISGFPAASNKKLLANNAIDSMLQLYEPFTIRGVQTLYLNVTDGYPISQEILAEGIAFIRKQQAKGKRVLVTCGAGVSRSVTFSVAALKEVEDLSLEEAYLSIREHHTQALPDHIHWDSLREYYGEGPEFWEVWKHIVLDGDDED